MNKIVNSLLLCLLFTTTQAQQDKSELGFRLGLQVNAGVNRLMRTDMWMVGELVSSTKPLFGGGLEIGYRFNRYFSVYTGMGISRYGFRVKLKKEPHFGNLEWFQVFGHTSYWEMPIRLRYHQVLSDVVALYIDAGVKGGLLQSFRSNYYVNVPSLVELTVPQDDRSDFAKWLLNPLLGIGTQLSLGTHFELHIGAECAYGLNDYFAGLQTTPEAIENAAVMNVKPEVWKGYSLSGMLKLGFYFKL